MCAVNIKNSLDGSNQGHKTDHKMASMRLHSVQALRHWTYYNTTKVLAYNKATQLNALQYNPQQITYISV